MICESKTRTDVCIFCVVVGALSTVRPRPSLRVFPTCEVITKLFCVMSVRRPCDDSSLHCLKVHVGL